MTAWTKQDLEELTSLALDLDPGQCKHCTMAQSSQDSVYCGDCVKELVAWLQQADQEYLDNVAQMQLDLDYSNQANREM